MRLFISVATGLAKIVSAASRSAGSRSKTRGTFGEFVESSTSLPMGTQVGPAGCVSY